MFLRVFCAVLYVCHVLRVCVLSCCLLCISKKNTRGKRFVWPRAVVVNHKTSSPTRAFFVFFQYCFDFFLRVLFFLGHFALVLILPHPVCVLCVCVCVLQMLARHETGSQEGCVAQLGPFLKICRFVGRLTLNLLFESRILQRGKI